jgi:hypothetical protein
MAEKLARAVSNASRQGQFLDARSLSRRAECTSRAGIEASLARSVSVVASCQPGPAAARVSRAALAVKTPDGTWASPGGLEVADGALDHGVTTVVGFDLEQLIEVERRVSPNGHGPGRPRHGSGGWTNFRNWRSEYCSMPASPTGQTKLATIAP